ncbi:hypothetical protein ACLOJK_011147 [Asimina triloba]
MLHYFSCPSQFGGINALPRDATGFQFTASRVGLANWDVRLPATHVSSSTKKFCKV